MQWTSVGGVRRLALVAGGVAAAASVHGQDVPRAVLATTGPIGVIPGTANVPPSSFTQARTRLSTTGTWWTVTANATSQPTTNDTFIVAGTSAGAVRSVPETVVLPGVGFGFTGRPDAQLGVNDRGDLAFKITSTAPIGSNRKIVRYVASSNTYDIIAREGQPVPGFPGETYSSFLDSITIHENARVSFRAASTLGPLPTNQSDFIFISGTPQTTLLQAGFFVPTDQLGGTTADIADINDNGFVGENLTSYMIEGSLNLATNFRCLVVNNRVVLQAGGPVPELGDTVPQALNADFRFSPANDHWVAWGASAGGISYILADGQLQARAGGAVPGGVSGETFTIIRDAAVNSNGGFAYFASTSAQRNVIVYDGPTTPARVVVATYISSLGLPEATRLDFTGDGAADDAYCAFINDETLGLSDAGELYFICRAISGVTFSTVADALYVVPLEGGCYPNCDGSTGSPLLTPADFVCFLSRFRAGDGYANCDRSTGNPALTPADFVCFLQAYRAGC